MKTIIAILSIIFILSFWLIIYNSKTENNSALNNFLILLDKQFNTPSDVEPNGKGGSSGDLGKE